MISPRHCARRDRASLPRPFAGPLAPPHRDGATALEVETGDETPSFGPQIAARNNRLEKAARRRPPPAALLVDVEIARALVVAGVEIADRLDARLGGSGAKRLEQRPSHPRRLDPPFAADAMISARPEEIILMALETGQHVVPSPAGEAELAPVIVVGGLAAHIDHGVDGGRAADHLAAGIVQAAAVEAVLRLGLEHPVRTRIADGEEIADRDVVPDPIVAPAGLQQQHARIRPGRQPVRQHAAGRAGADDDIVVIAVDGVFVHGGNVPRRNGGRNVTQARSPD
jgi:hypothetical protein